MSLPRCSPRFVALLNQVSCLLVKRRMVGVIAGHTILPMIETPADVPRAAIEGFIDFALTAIRMDQL